MGVQLILCLETNKQTKSDYIYIKNAIDTFYKPDPANVKLTVVYLGGKYNYNKAKTGKEIATYIKQYSVTSKTNRSEVVFCFDCDDYDVKNEDASFLQNAKEYCKSNGYHFVWFCKDIEHVFLGERIKDIDKKRRAEDFQRKRLIKYVDQSSLEVETYKIKKSNLGIILKRVLGDDFCNIRTRIL